MVCPIIKHTDISRVIFWNATQLLSVLVSHSVMSDSCATPWTVAHQGPCPWNFPGKNTRVGFHDLLQGNFQAQGLNPGLLL